MASSYDISTGTGRVEIVSDESTYLAVQVVADAALDADITVKLQHSSDGSNYEDLANTSTTMVSGGGSVLLESFDYVLSKGYLYVDVGSATAGELTIYTSSKKKIESEDVTATISGEVDANLTNTELDVIIDSDSEAINLLRNILKQQKLTNKLLSKILT